MPVEPAGAVLEDHAVAVRDGRIEALAPQREAQTRFAGYEQIELPRHALLPGLVNAHTHAAMVLARGSGAELALEATPEQVREGTLLACAEMLRGGITCFGDLAAFPEASLEAAAAAGMRCAQGLMVAESASRYASDPADYLRKGLDLRDRLGEEPLASFCLAPWRIEALSDQALRQVAKLAAEIDIPVRVLLREDGARALERLDRFGLLGPNLIAGHAARLEKGAIAQLARHGCSVVHCPSAELRGGGAAPLAALREAGVNVALGSDSAALSHRLDVLQEMRIAALLAPALPPHELLHAATLAGARALGIERSAGSIAPGKAADLAAVELGALELAPPRDPLARLVYAVGREHVTHVWVAGRLALRERNLQNPAFSALDTRSELWHNL